MKRSKIALALTVAVSMLSLTACNDDDYSPASNQQPTYLSEGNYSLDTVEYSSSIKVMTYNMTNVQGKTATATAMVLFPQVARPKDGYRVVVWEHGTVGGGDDCAPSKNMIHPRFKILANTLLAAGYVIVAPDYEGLGTSGVHPYLNLSNAAKSALSAVQAAKDHYGKQLNGAWMSVGQSQGGHASLATAEYANTDTTYKGAVAGAPASSLGQIIQIYLDPQYNLDVNGQPKANGLNILDDKLKQVRIAMANGLPAAHGQALIAQIAEGYAELLAYAALTGVGIKAYEPRFNYQDIFQSRAKSLAEFAEGSTGDNGLCLDNDNDPSLSLINKFKDDIIQFMTANPDKKVMDYPGLDTSVFATNETVKNFLISSQPGTKRIDKPVYVIQGTADTNVPYPITQALVANLKTLGSPDVTLDPVIGASHTQAIICRNAEAVDFIQTHMSAGTGIVLTDAQKDASINENCTGIAPT